MKFSCKKQRLEKAALAISRFVGSKSGSDTLEGIFVLAKNGTLALKGYNLEIGATTEIPAETEKEGSAILPSRVLCDIAKKSSHEDINVSTTEDFKTEVLAGNSKFLIAGVDPKAYPELPSVDGKEKMVINFQKLKDMIRQTAFAASTNLGEPDPTYTGVLFEIKDKKIKLVALDGYRMAVREETINTDKTASFIIPAKTLSELLKLESQDEKINIIIGKNHALFEASGFRIVSRLIEGKFLDYKSSTPEKFLSKATLSALQLVKALERVSLITNDLAKTPMRLLFKEDVLKIFCSTGSGKASDEIEINLEGEPLEIGVNGKYLLEALKNSESDKIKLQMNGPLSPIKIVPTKSEEFMFLVLPVRLKAEEALV